MYFSNLKNREKDVKGIASLNTLDIYHIGMIIEFRKWDVISELFVRIYM